MHISIFASIGCQNLGDELILKNEILIFEKTPSIFGLTEFKDIPNFNIFTYDTEDIFFEKENISYKEYFPKDIRNPKKILKNIKNYSSFLESIIFSDFLVIGGGGLFYDSELQTSTKNLDLWLWRIKKFKKYKKKIIFYGVSIDIKQEENKEKIKLIFSPAYKIFVRDEHSKKFLGEMGISSEIILDPVFFDNGKFFPDKNLLLGNFPSKGFDTKNLSSYDFTGKIVGLALRGGYFSKSREEENEIIKNILGFILSAGAREVLLLPHSFHKTDIQANDKIFLEQFVGEDIIIGGENIKKIYEIYKNKQIDICFCMRLHSIILCQVYKIPFITLSYAKKTDETIKKLQE
ncbi:polysaccharide pyruvyl transferase family protein [Candidatus Gracilibacteria bacterium]|nr:polysaccharide pyruvyl transferase family protein [Candidatus Gracilibacteria bacterium]NUJ98566.1 polysaccharide pyruvyl transferase family protein [Candidatus Gracilibacteria bacterium]